MKRYYVRNNDNGMYIRAESEKAAVALWVATKGAEMEPTWTESPNGWINKNGDEILVEEVTAMKNYLFRQDVMVERAFVIPAENEEDARLLFENGRHEQTKNGPYLSYGVTEFGGPGIWGREILLDDWSEPEVEETFVDSAHDYYNPDSEKRQTEPEDERQRTARETRLAELKR